MDIDSGYVDKVTQDNADPHPTHGGHTPMQLVEAWPSPSPLTAIPIFVGRAGAQAHLVSPHAPGASSFKALVSPKAALKPASSKCDISSVRDKQASSTSQSHPASAFCIHQEGRIVQEKDNPNVLNTDKVTINLLQHTSQWHCPFHVSLKWTLMLQVMWAHRQQGAQLATL